MHTRCAIACYGLLVVFCILVLANLNRLVVIAAENMNVEATLINR